jgi:hypothetical protein
MNKSEEKLSELTGYVEICLHANENALKEHYNELGKIYYKLETDENLLDQESMERNIVQIITHISEVRLSIDFCVNILKIINEPREL